MDTNVNQSNEMTNFDLWQIERYGNILPTIQVTPEGDLFESGIEELNRMAEYMDRHAELQQFENY